MQTNHRHSAAVKNSRPSVKSLIMSRAACIAVTIGTIDNPFLMRKHDPDQDGRSTGRPKIRAVSCSTRFLDWSLRGWIAGLVLRSAIAIPTPPPLAAR